MPPHNRTSDAILQRLRDDQRRWRRVVVGVPCRFLIDSDPQEHAGIVLNMSAGGMLIDSDVAPAAGARLVVYVDGFGRHEAETVRAETRGFAVTMRAAPLKRERTVEALMTHMNSDIVDGSVLRRHDRAEGGGRAVMLLGDGREVGCEVIDLSLSGLSLKTDTCPPVGAAVMIGQMRGRVVRHHENGVAVEFTGLPPSPGSLSERLHLHSRAA